jgi:hypothetical protein
LGRAHIIAGEEGRPVLRWSALGEIVVAMNVLTKDSAIAAGFVPPARRIVMAIIDFESSNTLKARVLPLPLPPDDFLTSKDTESAPFISGCVGPKDTFYAIYRPETFERPTLVRIYSLHTGLELQSLYVDARQQVCGISVSSDGRMFFQSVSGATVYSPNGEAVLDDFVFCKKLRDMQTLKEFPRNCKRPAKHKEISKLFLSAEGHIMVVARVDGMDQPQNLARVCEIEPRGTPRACLNCTMAYVKHWSEYLLLVYA